MQAIGGNIFDSYAKFRDAFDAHFECPRGGELPVAYVHDGKTTYYSYPATIKGSLVPPGRKNLLIFRGNVHMTAQANLSSKFFMTGAHTRRIKLAEFTMPSIQFVKQFSQP